MPWPLASLHPPGNEPTEKGLAFLTLLWLEIRQEVDNIIRHSWKSTVTQCLWDFMGLNYSHCLLKLQEGNVLFLSLLKTMVHAPVWLCPGSEVLLLSLAPDSHERGISALAQT